MDVKRIIEGEPKDLDDLQNLVALADDFSTDAEVEVSGSLIRITTHE